MINPLEEKILRYLIENHKEGKYTGIRFEDESLADICMAVKSLSRKGLVKEYCTTLSASALLTPDGRYYFEMKENNKTKNNNEGFYQVLIITNKNEKVTEVDINDSNEVFERILIPYLSEQEFYVNGFVLRKDKISRLKIGITEKSADKLAAHENETMPQGILMFVSASDIVEYNKYTKDVTSSMIAKAKQIILENNKNLGKNKKMDYTQVFIVHGRDNELKQEVARFVERFGIKPIILHEQPSQGMTIIEKIEAYSNVGFGIVLYTPCDVGYKKNHECDKMGRARQNVVFEHGFLIGKLGRSHVCALVKEEVEKPNDISGVVYVNYDEAGAWKYELAKELRSAGYDVDMNKI